MICFSPVLTVKNHGLFRQSKMDKTLYPTYATGENEFPPRSEEIPAAYDLNPTDTSWILLCAFIIFTMQIGGFFFKFCR